MTSRHTQKDRRIRKEERIIYKTTRKQLTKWNNMLLFINNYFKHKWIKFFNQMT